MRTFLLLASSALVLTLASCDEGQDAPQTSTSSAVTQTVSNKAEQTAKVPTVQDAKEFIEQAEKELVELREHSARVYWVQANFITEDTNYLAAKAGAESAKLSTRLANGAKAFNDLTLPKDMRLSLIHI